MGIFLGNMVIAQGGTESTTLGTRLLRTVKSLAIHGPSALTGTVTLRSADNLALSSYTTVQSGGSDITVTASKVVVITEVPMSTIRLKSGAGEGSERTFPVFGEEKAHA